MRSVHPDSFQCALIPIPGNGVVWIRRVPVDSRVAVEDGHPHDPQSEQRFPTRIGSAKRYIKQWLVHKVRRFPPELSGLFVASPVVTRSCEAKRTNCVSLGTRRFVWTVNLPL